MSFSETQKSNSKTLAHPDQFVRRHIGPNAAETRIEGTITAVNSAQLQITIKQQNGTSVVVQAMGGTKIERNGVRVALGALKVGDRGQARITAGTTTKIESVGS